MRAALGVLGLIATLGITVYELRNSQLYEAAMHRAKTLESRLGMEGSSSQFGRAGLFGERPPYVRASVKSGERKELRFWFLTVKHDYGLALIYGAALGAWVYLALYGLLTIPAPAKLWTPVSIGYLRLFSGLLGITAGTWSTIRLVMHDKNRLKTPLPVRLVPRVAKVSFVPGALVVDFADGRTVQMPLAWYPGLEHGAAVQREHCELIRDGRTIRWPDLNVHINIEDMLAGRPSD